ncbi:MAG: FMN-binding protein [Pseudomonadota bacterium]
MRLKPNEVRMLVAMVATATLCVAVLAGVANVLQPRIVEAKREAREEALARIVAPFRNPVEGLGEPIGEVSGLRGVPILRSVDVVDRDDPLVVIERIVVSGYAGDIEMMLSIDPRPEAARLMRVEVTAHRETPGIGDVIERRRSGWITQFEDVIVADANQLLGSGGTLDAVSGATITTDAVARGVRITLNTFSSGRFAR